MTTRHASFWLLALTLLLAACSDETSTPTASTSGGGSGGAAGTAGSGGTAGQGGGSGTSGQAGAAGEAGSGGQDACSAAGEGAGPYATTFLFKNDGDKAVYLWQECQYDLAVTACASGYATPMVLSASCSSDCDNFQGCLDCGACPSGPVEVAPGGQKEFSWSGNTYTFEMKVGCQCHRGAIAPAGKYRIAVPVWDTKPDENQPKPASSRTVTLDFELTKASQQIEVALD